MNNNTRTSAFVWSNYHAIGAVPFFSVGIDEPFYFPSNPSLTFVRVQSKGGWYAELMPSGRVSTKRWRTGKFTAVITIPK
jgi:hypothetical protein